MRNDFAASNTIWSWAHLVRCNSTVPIDLFNAVGLLSALLLTASLTASGSAATPRHPGVDLLDPAPAANDLGRWQFYSQDAAATFADTWRVDRGVLICRGQPLGYLYTKKKYTDFVLSLQYRIPRQSQPHKGGVLIRMTGKHTIWPKSLEAQINHPDAGDFWGLGGFRFDGPASRKKVIANSRFGSLTHLAKAVDAGKPIGEWNDYTIRAEGGTVTLTLNGREVNRATDCDVTAGPILLTAEGNTIHFRNLRLVTKQRPVVTIGRSGGRRQ